VKVSYVVDGEANVRTTRMLPKGLCMEQCPFFDDSSGFYWCNHYKMRLNGPRNQECHVRMIVIEEEE